MKEKKLKKGKLFNVWLNPIQIIDVDEPWASLTERKINSDRFLEFMCTPGISYDIKSLLKRYLEISQEKKRIFVAPAEERILNKLVWPLRHAKASYTVGNYLGTISLCGMVAEMVAILFFEISNFSINNRPMTTEEEKALFGSIYEKLGQHRRVEILSVYNIIDEETKKDFDLIRTTRRKYLHLWSKDHNTLPTDARAVFNSAVSLVVKVIGQDIYNGMILLNPVLVKYLERSGIYKPNENEDEQLQ